MKTEGKQRQKGRKVRKLAAWTLLGTAVGSLGYAFSSGLVQAERQAWPLYQRVGANGMPLDGARFSASMAIPEEENAASQWVPAAKALNNKLESLPEDVRRSLRNPRPAIQMPAEFYATQQNYFKQIEREWNGLHAASARPRFVPRTDILSPYFYTEVGASQVTMIAQMAAPKAIMHATLGEHQSAMRELRLAARMSEYASDIPSTILYLVGVALYAILASSVERCIQADPENSALYAGVLRTTRMPSPGKAIRGEAFEKVSHSRTLGNQDLLEWLVRLPATNFARRLGAPLEDYEPGYWMPPESFQQEGLPANLFARATLSRLLYHFEPVLLTLDQDGNEKIPGTLGPALEEAERNLRSSTLNIDALPRSMALFLQLAKPHQKTQAQAAVTFAMVDIFEFRQKQGRWPSALRELGKVPNDPMLPHEPLRYRLVGDGFRVWGVGDDLTDNDGHERLDHAASYPQPWYGQGVNP